MQVTLASILEHTHKTVNETPLLHYAYLQPPFESQLAGWSGVVVVVVGGVVVRVLDRSLKSSLKYQVKHPLIDFVIAHQSIGVTDQSQSPLAAFKP